MRYFELNDDINFPGRWYLGDIANVDNWELSFSWKDDFDVLDVGLVRNGLEMDFTFTECYRVPVVSLKVKKALEDFHGLSFVPVRINGKICSTDYFILIVNDVVQCVDEKRSEFQKFEENDPVRPDKSGEYRAFMRLRIDEKSVGEKDVFRLKGFEIAVVISERVKSKLDFIGATGVDVDDIS